jgi:hypothetical protein
MPAYTSTTSQPKTTTSSASSTDTGVLSSRSRPRGGSIRTKTFLNRTLSQPSLQGQRLHPGPHPNLQQNGPRYPVGTWSKINRHAHQAQYQHGQPIRFLRRSICWVHCQCLLRHRQRNLCSQCWRFEMCGLLWRQSCTSQFRP